MILDDQIARTYLPINLKKYDHFLDVGGRMCTKSSKNALLIASLVMKYPECDVVVIRQYQVTHLNTTLRELLSAFDRLGLIYGEHYTYNVRPVQINMTNGNRIYFGGLDDPEKLKGFKPTSDNHFIGVVWFFEVSEFKDSEPISQARSTFSRGKKKFYKNIYETNPPPDRHHWFYAWEEGMQADPEVLYTFKTYLDLTDWEKQHWLGNGMKEIEMLKRLDEDQYNHVYLGQLRVLEDRIYNRLPKFTTRPKSVDSLLFGFDFGQVDATACIAVGVKDGIFYVLDEYYHKDKGGKYTINDYITDTIEFCNNLVAEFDSAKEKILYVDVAPSPVYPLFVQDKRLHRKLIVRKVKKGSVFQHADVIQERIDATNLLIADGKLKVCHEKMQFLVELENAKYLRGKREDNKTTNIDTLDAFEYAIRNKIRFILKGVYKELALSERERND